MKKYDIGNLIQQSIINREHRAKARAIERKGLEDSTPSTDPLYHFFYINVPYHSKTTTSSSTQNKK